MILFTQPPLPPVHVHQIQVAHTNRPLQHFAQAANSYSQDSYGGDSYSSAAYGGELIEEEDVAQNQETTEGSQLLNTGTALVGATTLAAIIILSVLVTRLWKRPASK